MKQAYNLIVLALVASIFVFFPKTDALAQEGDTLLVEWYDSSKPGPYSNNLYEVIRGDTTSEGERVPNRVYQLRQGGFYYVSESLQNDGYHLNIVGNGPKEVAEDGDNPPMIQMSSREDGSTPGKLMNVRGDLTLKDVILNGKSSLGELKYEVVDVRYDGGTFTFDNVIFEYAQWGIMGFYSVDADIYITNSKFRNLVSETQPWGGRGFSVWLDADTVWVENNSFLNIGGFTAQIEGGTANLFMFNQNTIVNNGRQLVLGAWLQNAFITNNLILNGFWQGESATEIGADRLASTDEQYAGMFAIDNLPAEYGLDIQRNIVIANNSFFLEDAYTDYFTADSDTFDIRKQPLLNVRTENLFDANPNMIVSDNMFDAENPGFTAYADNHADRVQFITDIRNANSPITTHYWDPGRAEDHTSVQWPLPEDLTYSNTTLQAAAIGEYPLGDLNWYPDEKADWEANRQAQYDAIMDLLGEEVTVQFMASLEGEDGEISGGAAVGSVDDEDRQYARVEATGTVLWDPVEVEAGTYDVLVSQKTWWDDSNPDRATDVYVNDVYSYITVGGAGSNGVDWSDVTIASQTFTGTDSVKLAKNWGYLEYRYVQLLEEGTSNVVKTLWAGEAELVGGGSYICPEGATCLSGEQYAETNDGGSIKLSYTSEGEGTFILRINHFLTGSETQTIDVSVGDQVYSVELTGTDSTLTEVDINNVAISDGLNEITIAGTGIVLDKVDVFLIGSLMEVSNEEDGSLASQFQLSQNYPNPFNPSTNINFTLPAATNVQLTVFNLLGQKVATLIDEPRMAGNYTVKFDASHLASGIYFYTLQAGEVNLQRKMTLIK